jgi:hypothetical protein
MMAIFLFAFLFLIPKGKEYRTLRLENKKESRILGVLREEHSLAQEKLEKLEKTHKDTIKAFESSFNPKKFTRMHEKEFQDLFLSEIEMSDHNGSFRVYEVNATAKINSPETFYHFLDKVNHSDWIIGVNFPIHFEREGDLIKSSFTMKVHHFSEVKEEIEDEKEPPVKSKKSH